MGYLSNRILKHSATYTPINKDSINGYGEFEKGTPITLTNIYITRNTSQQLQDGYLTIPSGEMLLFYDLGKSQPLNTTFSLDSIIDFKNESYKIIDVHNAFKSHMEIRLERINND